MKDNGEMLEEKLENLFSVSGINFKNVRFNDNMVTERISKLTNSGWTLENVATSAYGTEKTSGIYLTRYLFKSYLTKESHCLDEIKIDFLPQS